jgi:ubiquitin-like protein Pup
MPTHESHQNKRSRRDQDHEAQESEVVTATSNAELDNDVDALLDEIDEILEVNAEDFVKSFVQKGGQ